VSCNIVREWNGFSPPISKLLPDAAVQVTCVALLYIAHARVERDASKAAALKSRRGSISSSSSATAFDIQATVHVAAVLHRLMLLLNSVVPAVVLRCCQVKFTLTFGRINGFV
jgi:hypothetical protein